MAVVTMKQLLEAGVHFGHQTRRWNPKMAPYIFTERNGIYIIDLQKTVKMIEESCNFIKEVVSEGKSVLFVGTKKQAQDSVREEAERCGMYYVNVRWLGGMLTNFQTIRKRVERLRELEKMEESGHFELLTKKEVTKLKTEKEKSVGFLFFYNCVVRADIYACSTIFTLFHVDCIDVIIFDNCIVRALINTGTATLTLISDDLISHSFSPPFLQ
jgi:hypothetical protein